MLENIYAWPLNGQRKRRKLEKAAHCVFVPRACLCQIGADFAEGLERNYPVSNASGSFNKTPTVKHIVVYFKSTCSSVPFQFVA